VSALGSSHTKTEGHITPAAPRILAIKRCPLCAKSGSRLALFDHLVGGGEQCRQVHPYVTDADPLETTRMLVGRVRLIPLKRSSHRGPCLTRRGRAAEHAFDNHRKNCPRCGSDNVHPPRCQIASSEVGPEASGRIHGGALEGSTHGPP
jgi:hypothetical protein